MRSGNLAIHAVLIVSTGDIAGVFALAAEKLLQRSARDWLDMDEIVPAK